MGVQLVDGSPSIGLGRMRGSVSHAPTSSLILTLYFFLAETGQHGAASVSFTASHSHIMHLVREAGAPEPRNFALDQFAASPAGSAAAAVAAKIVAAGGPSASLPIVHALTVLEHVAATDATAKDAAIAATAALMTHSTGRYAEAARKTCCYCASNR